MKLGPISDVILAATAAEEKHGKISEFNERRLAVLMEEIGEVAREVIELRPKLGAPPGSVGDSTKLRAELAQVGGYVLLWLEALEVK